MFVLVSVSLQKKIDSLSEDFKRETAKNRAKVQEILAILRDKFPNGGNEEISHGLMPEFPLVTIEEYVQFNDMLKNDEQIRKCFVSNFSFICNLIINDE